MTQLHLTLHPADPHTPAPARLSDLAAHDSTYLGYFQDPAGYQWLYVLDRRNPDMGLLYGNRYAWTAYPTMHGTVADLDLDPPVVQWLQLVTATAQWLSDELPF
ncbi:MAG: hypothetical protein KKB13_10690 [Chloroflexi bacterium]|nr:hypothetical protein [Chloroflexota bacterium]